MALHIPSNLYSGNAVVLDTRQPMQYYMQRMATQQAKNQALDSYYDKLHTAINPAGMRVQDIEGGFNKEVQDWRSFYNQTKAAIKDPAMDNGKAYNEHMSRYQSLLGRTEASKNEAKKEMLLAQHRLGGKWEPTDGDLDSSHRISLSIYDKDHYKGDGVTPYDISDISISHPDFTPQLQNQFLKAAVGDLKPGYEEQDLKNAVIDREHGKQSIPYTKKFADDQLKQIGDRGAYLYDGSQSAKKFFEKELLNPDEHDQLNETYRRVYGKDIQTPKEAAQAWTIHANLAAKETGNKIMNWTDPNKSFALKNYGFQLSKKLVDYRKAAGLSGDLEDGVDPIEATMKAQESAAISNGAIPYISDKNQTPTYQVKAGPELKKILAVKDGMKTYQPDDVRINDEGDYIGIFYKKKDGVVERSANGNIAIDPALPPVRISRENVKVSLGKELLTKKSNEKLMSQPKSAPVKTKKTKDNPLGLDLN